MFSLSEMHDQVCVFRASNLPRGFIRKGFEVTQVLHEKKKKASIFMVPLVGRIQTAYCSHFSCMTSIAQVSGPICITFIVFLHSSFYLPLIVLALKNPTTATTKNQPKPESFWKVFCIIAMCSKH